MPAPRTRYARSGDVNIAYQVAGDGPVDLVYVIGWVSNIDIIWEEPSYARFLERLASFSRLIVFDKRGCGLSDRVDTKDLPTMEMRMEDVRAVMNAAGSERAALLGISEGGPLCTLLAATYPERTDALINIGGYASGLRMTGGIGARTDAEWERALTWLEDHWGEDAARETLRDRAPSKYGDQRFRDWWERYLRLSASPAAVAALTRMNREIDVRAALPAIRVPTLIVHASGDRAIRADNGRYLAREIAGARYIELDSQDHLPWVVQSDADAVVAAIEQLLTGKHTPVERDRVLATVLYTDIVDSTAKAAAMGDRGWREVIEAQDDFARGEVERAHGKLIKTLGDGVLAMFDGPGRAIRCAAALRERARGAGIEIRAGLHTGECELMASEDIGGIAATIGARVAALASGGEILVSSTVKDLVAGSGIEFDDRGAHRLKGVPGEWRIFAVTAV